METINKPMTFGEFKLLTRQEVMDMWNKSLKEYKDSYCCPSCRDILTIDEEGRFHCENDLCLLSDAQMRIR